MLKSRGFRASSLSTNDFSTRYAALPYSLIKEKLADLIESIFQKEGSPYLACSDRNAFSTSDDQNWFNPFVPSVPYMGHWQTV